MNIQVYWDGNVGACQYETRKGFFTTKPTIPTVTFETLVYSEDDNLAVKVANATSVPLTAQEIVAVKQFANANSVTSPSSNEASIDQHNTDPTAHHDIRVQLSNLSESTHKVATVWSTQIDLAQNTNTTIDIPWIYVTHQIADCTDAVNPINWISPANKSYDVTIKVGFSGLPSGINASLSLKKNGTQVLKKDFTNVTNVIQLSSSHLILAQLDKLSCSITFNKAPLAGVIVPGRTYFRVDNYGAVSAKRAADFVFNTLENMVFYSGVQARLQLDTAQNPAILADTWVIG